jgi:hypothetical protein
MSRSKSMSLKKVLLDQGTRLMSDPRVLKVMQSDQFMKALTLAMSLPGKVDGLTRDRAEKLAKKMQLATSDEIADLKRTVRALEDQIAEMKRERR